MFTKFKWPIASREVNRHEFEQTLEEKFWLTAVFSNEIFRATSATDSFSASVSSIASGSMRTSTSRANLLGNLRWFLHWHRSATLLWHRLARLLWHLAAALLGHRLALLDRLLDGLALTGLLGHPLARRLSWGWVAVAPPRFPLPIPGLSIPLVVTSVTTRWTNLKAKCKSQLSEHTFFYLFVCRGTWFLVTCLISRWTFLFIASWALFLVACWTLLLVACWAFLFVAGRVARLVLSPAFWFSVAASRNCLRCSS